MPKVIGIIPSRMESSRLPNKPLVDICGISMIEHVYKRSLMSKQLSELYVATDSEILAAEVAKFGGKSIMTSKNHQTGTDRIAEAAKSIECDYVVNIQGDEALVDPKHIDAVINFLIADPKCDVGILATPFKKYNSPSDIKVVLNKNYEVMYFSRSDIPSSARTPNPPMLKAYHIVPFRKDFLLKYASMEKTSLEIIEFNEYIRILENGYRIRAKIVESDAISVDTQSDLEYVRNKMVSDQYFKLYRPS